MGKIIKLTESDLVNLIKRVLSEEEMEEASSPAQQAAIAINMKKKGIKPKNETLHEDEDENAFQEHMYTLDHIANNFNRNTTEDELEFLISEIEYEVESAIRGEELSDDELDELTEYADFLVDELVHEFKLNMDLHEGTKAKKPRAMKSRRAGIKAQVRIDNNNNILKKLEKEVSK